MPSPTTSGHDRRHRRAPHAGSADVLKSYAPAEWVDRIWPTGNAVTPVPHFYDTPTRSRRTRCGSTRFRREAASPAATPTSPPSNCSSTPA